MSFLKRWQTRKDDVAREEVEQQAELEAKQAAEAKAAEEAAVEADATSELEAPADTVEAEPLPDPDAIEQGGSFAAFMKDDVDPLKRKEALQSLWKQPQFNVRDGLCEYDIDYTQQPKLSAEVAAELTKKVFRHAIKAEEEEAERLAAEQAELEAKQLDTQPEQVQSEQVQPEGIEPEQTAQLAKKPTERPDAQGVSGQNDPCLDPDQDQGQSQA